MTSSNTQVPSLQYGYTLQARTAHCLLGVTARDHTFSLQKQLPSTFKSWRRGIHFPWEGSREPFRPAFRFSSQRNADTSVPKPLDETGVAFTALRTVGVQGSGWQHQHWDSATEVLTLRGDNQGLLTCCAGRAFCFPVSSLYLLFWWENIFPRGVFIYATFWFPKSVMRMSNGYCNFQI